MSKLEPMLLKPAFRHMVWGGDKLKDLFGKALPCDTIGESWELACRSDLWSVVNSGPNQGVSLPALFQEHSEEILGHSADEFPWLIKLIDAKSTLSVQVHPDDAYAIPHGDVSGKTEMWYIVQADPGAKLIVGFNQDVTRELVEQKAADGTIPEILNEIQVRPGDAFFIPPGTVHAICGGLVILEIQQNSDATYRLYDWGRMGDDGKPRQLHIKKAADVVELSKSAPKAAVPPVLENGDQVLASCEFFRVHKRTLRGETGLVDGLCAVVSLSGRITLGDLSLAPGDCALVPHCAGRVPLCGQGEAVIVLP